MAGDISDWCRQGRIWKSIEIDDRVYTICSIKENRSWKIILTDLIEIWMQTLSHEAIHRKCQTLNPLLNLEIFDWEQSVTDMLNDIPRHVVEASVYNIKLQKDKSFIKLKFVLDFLKGEPQQLWENVIMPLCLSSKELIRQHEILLDLVKRKDEEIAEYKAEGAELIRKYIATKPFSEELFQTDFAAPVAADSIKTFQSMLHFYEAMNLPKSCIKADPEVSLNDTSDNNIPNGSRIDDNLQEFQLPNPSIEIFVAKMEQDELSKNEQSHSRHEEHECEVNPSTSKASVLKLNNISHTIHKSVKKNKKTLSDFIL